MVPTIFSPEWRAARSELMATNCGRWLSKKNQCALARPLRASQRSRDDLSVKTPPPERSRDTHVQNAPIKLYNRSDSSDAFVCRHRRFSTYLACRVRFSPEKCRRFIKRWVNLGVLSTRLRVVRCQFDKVLCCCALTTHFFSQICVTGKKVPAALLSARRHICSASALFRARTTCVHPSKANWCLIGPRASHTFCLWIKNIL